MEILNRPNSANTALKKWMQRLYSSHEKCPYCCKQKTDYICPDTGLLTPLICECEKKFVNFTKTKAGIEQTQFSIRENSGNNNTKMSHDDRRYMIESDKTIDILNEAIGKMRKLGYENQ